MYHVSNVRAPPQRYRCGNDWCAESVSYNPLSVSGHGCCSRGRDINPPIASMTSATLPVLIGRSPVMILLDPSSGVAHPHIIPTRTSSLDTAPIHIHKLLSYLGSASGPTVGMCHHARITTQTAVYCTRACRRSQTGGRASTPQLWPKA